jgi:uroporphyrin-III C-methyltransferase
MGKVYLVGAGPGAPTSSRCARRGCLEPPTSCCTTRWCIPTRSRSPKRARFIDVGKRYGKVSTEQRFIHRALIEAARTHDVVVRLKGGDPMIFGRAQEELDALAAAGIETEVVPGVTAALAAAARSRLAHAPRHRAHRVLPHAASRKGRDRSEWLPGRRSQRDTVVLYMAAGAGPQIARALIGAASPIYSRSARGKRHAPRGSAAPSRPSRRWRAAELPRAEGPVVVCVGRSVPRRRAGELQHRDTTRRRNE